MKEAITYLNQILKEHDCCVLALSGGPDSMCLLHLLINLEVKVNVVCAHVNHNTRENNKSEKEFIEKILKKENITFEYYEINEYEKNRFSEQEARDKRYQFLKTVVKEHSAKYLFTAHHGDDLVETILMRILRGSTLEGYCGIKKESIWDNVPIIRPLLTTTKKEIMDYIKKENIPFVIDETNEQDEYLRNRIRHNMLPLLEQEEKKYHLKFLKFNQTLEQANSVLDKIVENTLSEIKENTKINKNNFLKLECNLQRLVIRKYFKKIYGENLSLLNDKHVEISLNFLNDSNKSSSINLPNSLELFNTREYFWIEKKEEKTEYCIKCERLTILPDSSIIEQIEEYTQNSNDEIHLNSKNVELPLYITTRKNGMKMEIKNLNGHKKINDILIDKKIPKEKRDVVPILIDKNGTVLWILGVSKSKYDLEKNENYDIIFKYQKKEGI